MAEAEAKRAAALEVVLSAVVSGEDAVTPVAQDDGAHPVSAIAYPEPYVRAMDVFRGAMAAEVRSEAVLRLTEAIIEMNASHYTVWQYRRQCLQALRSDLAAEMQYLDDFPDPNPKNYQFWYHRRAVVAMMQEQEGQRAEPERELEYTAQVFASDSKNYHAWAHRQWVIKTFALWSDEELTFVDGLLQRDVRNNSAWNHRWFLVHQGKLPNAPDAAADAEVVRREIQYAMDKIRQVNANESPWTYLRGFFQAPDALRFQDVPEVREFALSIVNGQDEADAARGVHAWALLADIHLQSDEADRAIACYDTLRELDPVRTKYWADCVSRVRASTAT